MVDISTGDVLDELSDTMGFMEEEVNNNAYLRYIPQSIRVQDSLGKTPAYTIDGKQLLIDTPGEYYVAYTYQDRAGIRGVSVDNYNIIHSSSYRHAVVIDVLSESDVQTMLGGDSPPTANGKWICLIIEPAQADTEYDVVFSGAGDDYAFTAFPVTYDETKNRYYMILTYPVEGETIAEWLDFPTVDINDFSIQVHEDTRYDYLCYDNQRDCLWGIRDNDLHRLSHDYAVLDTYDLDPLTVKGLAYRHGWLYILDDTSKVHIYDAYAITEESYYQLTGDHLGLTFDIEGYMWTFSEVNSPASSPNALVKHRLYYDYYVNDEYDCFTRESYTTLVVNGVDSQQESYTLWTPLDTLGLTLDVARLPGESNVDYRERLRNVFVYPSDNTRQGLINSVSRAIGAETNIVYTNNTVTLRAAPLSYGETVIRDETAYNVGEHDDYNLLVTIYGIPIQRTTVVTHKESGSTGRVYRSVGQIFTVAHDTVLIGFHLGIVTDALARISLFDVDSELLVTHWYTNGFYDIVYPDTQLTLEANKEYMIVVESNGELNCAVDESESGLYATEDGLYNDMTEQSEGLEYTLYGYKETPASIQEYVAYNVDAHVWFSGDISNRYVSVSYLTEDGEQSESFFIEKVDKTSAIDMARPEQGSALPFQSLRTYGNSYLDETDWIDNDVDLLRPTMADAEYTGQVQSGHYADGLRTEIDRDGYPIIQQGEFNITDRKYYLCGRKKVEEITPTHEGEPTSRFTLDNHPKGQVMVT